MSNAVVAVSQSNGSRYLAARVRLLVAAGVAVVLCWAVFGFVRAQADSPASPIPVVVHTVVSGETLWQIASEVTEDGQDVRDVILAISDLNNLNDSHIFPGMRIMLPQ